MRDLLRSVLAAESRAYGFTIAFWGSGMLLVKASSGLPSLANILGYGLGAVLGFGLLSLLAFSGALRPTGAEDADYLVLSMVHYVAALAPIVVTAAILESGLPYRFVLAGANVSIIYNSGILFQELVSEEAMALEKRLMA